VSGAHDAGDAWFRGVVARKLGDPQKLAVAEKLAGRSEDGAGGDDSEADGEAPAASVTGPSGSDVTEDHGDIDQGPRGKVAGPNPAAKTLEQRMNDALRSAAGHRRDSDGVFVVSSE
jgi:hypothetical protein